MATPNRSTCKLDHCAEPVRHAGYCTSHYFRNNRTGDPLSKSEKIAFGIIPAPPTECSVDGCERPIQARGMCDRHYQNATKYGRAIPRKDWTAPEVIADTGWTVAESGCWEWDGSVTEKGYGLINIERQGLVGARVHRVMYELHVGPIPNGQLIRHRCDNPPCINPDHLEPGTPADNTSDMMERGRHWRHGATECQNGHDLTSPGSHRVARRKNRPDEKVCLTCQRERHLRHQEKKKLERAKLRDRNEAA